MKEDSLKQNGYAQKCTKFKQNKKNCNIVSSMYVRNEMRQNY